MTVHTSSIPTVTEPWYRHRWPWLLMAAPAAVVVAGFITIWLAFTHSDALVVDDYYKQGKAINQDLRRDRTAAELGIQAGLRYDPAAGKLSGALAAREALPDRGVKLRLVHPTKPELDLSLPAVVDAKGVFTADLPFLEKGRWRVLIEGEQGAWRLAGVWQWPQQKSIELHSN